VDASVRKLMDDMPTIVRARIGLAAPQVGVLKRIIVLDLAREGEEPQPLRIANPEVVWVSEDDATYNEGCLSVPEHYADVVRPAACRVKYLDQDNKQLEIAAEGRFDLPAAEIDPSDGVLFIDHSPAAT
jgi:peptide deformylase